jgi:hypothetical protein
LFLGDTYNVNLKKETERYIVNHKNELKENFITDIPFSVSEIKKCINKLKMKKSVGPDHICNEVIKFSSIVTCKSMDHTGSANTGMYMVRNRSIISADCAQL